jgi:cytochrome c-type protein NapB
MGCAGLSGSSAWRDGQSYRDDEIGLSKASVFTIPSPDPLARNTAESEDDVVLPREYDISPPRIPHSTEDMVPITRTENTCLDCHEEDLRGPLQLHDVPRGEDWG